MGTLRRAAVLLLTLALLAALLATSIRADDESVVNAAEDDAASTSASCGAGGLGDCPAADLKLDPSVVLDPIDLDSIPPPERTEEFQRLEQVYRDVQAGAGGHRASENECGSPFGTVLGSVHGVTAYSNCNDQHISEEDHVWTGKVPEMPGVVTTVTGMKWQCVEFARRYLTVKYGVTFGDVVGAVDMWRFTSVHKVNDPESRLNLGRYRNHDDADHYPANGSLVIWPIQKHMPFGHVAVVVDVIEDLEPAPSSGSDAGSDSPSSSSDVPVRSNDDGENVEVKPRRVARVRIGDQNYASTPWAQKGWLRELILETYDGVYFGLRDPDGFRILGWRTYEPFIKPLDQLLFTEDEPGLPSVAIERPKPRMKGSDDEAAAPPAAPAA